MSYVVEMVARAMAGPIWDTIPPGRQRDEVLGQARRAIEALREPGWMIIAAGDDAVVSAIQPRSLLAEPWDSPAGQCWRAMIDAALSAPPSSPSAGAELAPHPTPGAEAGR